MMRHPRKLILEYSRITKYVYIGNNKCCEPDFADPLLKKGIKADISLEDIRVDSPFGISFYLWLPVKDHQSPTFEQLFVGANFIKNLVKGRIKCYVHCRHGHGRAPTLVAAYLILEGMEVNEAIRFIKEKRSTIHLNSIQITALRNFKKKLGKYGNRQRRI